MGHNHIKYYKLYKFVFYVEFFNTFNNYGKYQNNHINISNGYYFKYSIKLYILYIYDYDTIINLLFEL